MDCDGDGALADSEVTRSIAVHVITVEIDGYVYGESGRKIEDIHNLSPAYVVAHGYLQLKARVEPSSQTGNLYYKWTKSASPSGTFDGATEGAGSTYTEVKWNAHQSESTCTLTLEVKESSAGNVICTKTVDLRPVRPKVVRVKFVKDNLLGYEYQIVDGGDPEYDSIAGTSYPVCYRMEKDMQIQWDMAGSSTDETINDLSAKTEIQIYPVAKYGGNSLTFTDEVIDDNTTDWSLSDYGDLESETSTSSGIYDKVGEFEDFTIEWTFMVKNSLEIWIVAYTEGGGYSQKSEHWEVDGSEKYGLFLIKDAPLGGQQLLKKHLNFVCETAHGYSDDVSIATTIHNSLVDNTPPYKPEDASSSWILSVDGWSLLFPPAGENHYGECVHISRLMTYSLWLLGIDAELMELYGTTDNDPFSPEDKNFAPGEGTDPATCAANASSIHTWLVLDFGPGPSSYACSSWVSYGDSLTDPKPNWNAFEGVCKAAGFYWAQYPELIKADAMDILRNVSMKQYWAKTLNDTAPGVIPFQVGYPPVQLTPVPLPP